MTPRELMKELKLIIKNHPEAQDHTLFFSCEECAGRTAHVMTLRWDGKRKRIILEE